jgi:hypothetical protein
MILKWADAFRARMGFWPNQNSGMIAGVDRTWMAVDSALKRQPLPGRSTLLKLLAEQRGYRNVAALPRMSVSQVLRWADAYRARTGQWPTTKSGPIPSSSCSENWRSVDHALRCGNRGLPKHSSLARLLAVHRGRRNGRGLPRLTYRQVLAWADAYRLRSGRWPIETSGPIREAPGETWFGVDRALRAGVRGFRGGCSLPRLLARYRRARNIQALPRYTLSQILLWAERYFRRTGSWPQTASGPVVGATGETWGAVNSALTSGRRGLPGGSSLAKLLAKARRRAAAV